MKYPKRIVEVDLPIARISAHARREKSIRHGHISTLHIWWARRPLAACRAVICAALWPDPADELCPQAFRDAAVEQIKFFANRVFPRKITEEGRLLASEKHCSPQSREHWAAIAAGTLSLNAAEVTDMPLLRMCLLDFIADFANWDNSTVPAYLETSRAITQAAHEAIGGDSGTKPLVVDPFAGGGSIPLEALRVGADAFASDLNPVAVLLNKVMLEYVPKYGARLANALREYGQKIGAQAEAELANIYPRDATGAIPTAYLWARTIKCEGPSCGVSIPLLRTTWLKKHGKNKVALSLQIDNKTGEVVTNVINANINPKSSSIGLGTISRGNPTCPACGYTVPLKRVKEQLRSRQGGTVDARLFAVVLNNGAIRNPTAGDLAAIDVAKRKLASKKRTDSSFPLSFVPNEDTLHYHTFVNRASVYGMSTWEDFYTIRQRLTLGLLCQAVRNLKVEPNENEFETAVKTVLALVIGRGADYWSSLATWAGNFVAHTFGRQALPFVWDYAEVAPFSPGSGNWSGAIDWVARVIERESKTDCAAGIVQQSDAANPILPNDAAAALITDPPYYYAIQYADLSDYFYVWLRRSIGNIHPSLFSESETPKAEEAIVQSPGDVYAESGKNRKHYETVMSSALGGGRRILAPNGIAVVVFANATTDGWEALLDALVSQGWVITASWPIDTERPGRVISSGRSVLASSVHLVCRPRETESGELRAEVGEWRDVLSELPKRIHQWMPRLAEEGVVGADAIFACLGPALEVFSRYSRVEKANGEAVALREYLEHVWAAVSTEALTMIFKDADAAGLEPDARLTAMWLWTLGAGTGKAGGNGQAVEVVPGMTADDEDESPSEDKATASSGYTLEFDAARKIAQGLGIHLEQSERIVEVKGDKARLLPVSERAVHLFGKQQAIASSRRKRAKAKQQSLFEELDTLEAETEAAPGELKPEGGATVLDRVHQAMILFASGRGEALRRFLVDDGAGKDARFWKLAQSLSALYPPGTDEKRWVDGVLARKKGLGL